jgi:hypothetical protein
VSAWRFEVIRFPSAGREIALTLRVEPPPECRIEHGRITLTFRRLAASRWPEPQQIEFALRAANVARDVCASDDRRQLRRAAKWATVVVLEDASIASGCAVVTRWECVVPAKQ